MTVDNFIREAAKHDSAVYLTSVEVQTLNDIIYNLREDNRMLREVKDAWADHAAALESQLERIIRG